MQLFLDTANVDEIREAWHWGVIDGVTTNPTHIAATGRSLEAVLAEIFQIVDGPVSIEAVATDAQGIIEQGRRIAALHPNAVVKIPVTVEGLRAAKVLSREGIKTNVTLCFSPLQAFLAAKVGATYISPFVHRLDLVGHDGGELLRQIRSIYDHYGFRTKILAASIRSPKQVLDALLAVADVATLPFAVLRALYDHPLTETGLNLFLKDWERVPAGSLLAGGQASR